MSPLALEQDHSGDGSDNADTTFNEDDSDFLLGHLNALLQFLDEHLDFEGSLKYRRMVMKEMFELLDQEMNEMYNVREKYSEKCLHCNLKM